MPRSPHGMRPMGRTLLRIGAGLAALVVLAAAGAYLALRASLPVLDGRVATRAVAERVTIERDADGLHVQLDHGETLDVDVVIRPLLSPFGLLRGIVANGLRRSMQAFAASGTHPPVRGPVDARCSIATRDAHVSSDISACRVGNPRGRRPRSRRSRLTSGPRACSARRARATSTIPRRCRSTCRPSRPASPARSARRIASRSAAWPRVSTSCCARRPRATATTSRPSSRRRPAGWRTARRSATATC